MCDVSWMWFDTTMKTPEWVYYPPELCEAINNAIDEDQEVVILDLPYRPVSVGSPAAPRRVAVDLRILMQLTLADPLTGAQCFFPDCIVRRVAVPPEVLDNTIETSCESSLRRQAPSDLPTDGCTGTGHLSFPADSPAATWMLFLEGVYAAIAHDENGQLLPHEALYAALEAAIRYVEPDLFPPIRSLDPLIPQRDSLLTWAAACVSTAPVVAMHCWVALAAATGMAPPSESSDFTEFHCRVFAAVCPRDGLQRISIETAIELLQKGGFAISSVSDAVCTHNFGNSHVTWSQWVVLLQTLETLSPGILVIAVTVWAETLSIMLPNEFTPDLPSDSNAARRIRAPRKSLRLANQHSRSALLGSLPTPALLPAPTPSKETQLKQGSPGKSKRSSAVRCRLPQCHSPAVPGLNSPRAGLCARHAGRGTCARQPFCAYDAVPDRALCVRHICPVCYCEKSLTTQFCGGNRCMGPGRDVYPSTQVQVQ